MFKNAYRSHKRELVFPVFLSKRLLEEIVAIKLAGPPDGYSYKRHTFYKPKGGKMRVVDLPDYLAEELLD